MIDRGSFDQLVHEFRDPRPEFDGLSYEEQRPIWWADRVGDTPKLLREVKVQNLSIDEAMEIFRELRTGTIRRYQGVFRSNGIRRIRNTLKYLLYGNKEIETRFTRVTTKGERYKLDGASVDFASTVLRAAYPDRYSVSNAAATGGLKALGMIPCTVRGETKGERYLRVNSAIRAVMELSGFADLNITDEFLYTIADNKLPSVSRIKESSAPLFDGFEVSDFDVFIKKYQSSKTHDDARCLVREKIESLAKEVEPYMAALDPRFILNVSRCKVTRGPINGIWAAFTFEEPYYKNIQLNFGIYNGIFTIGIEIPKNCSTERQSLGNACIKQPEWICGLLESFQAFWYLSGQQQGLDDSLSSTNEIRRLGKMYTDNRGWASFCEGLKPNEQILNSPLLGERIRGVLQLLYPLFLVIIGEEDLEELAQARSRDGTPRSGSPDKNSNEVPPEASDYLRATRKTLRVIKPRHKRMARRFAKWLIENGYKKVEVEKNQIDLRFRGSGTRYMAELKIVYSISTKHAIREAVGQVLEYNYYEGRKPADKWVILIDSEPSDEDRKYIKRLSRTHNFPLNLGWQDGSEFCFMNQL